MSTEHHILKAILSCSIFFVKPSGNVLSWVNFLSWDSVVGMTKIMVNEGKGLWPHVSPVSSTMKIVSLQFFCPMNKHRQRFLQKTTWTTIMSQDDAYFHIHQNDPDMGILTSKRILKWNEHFLFQPRFETLAVVCFTQLWNNFGTTLRQFRGKFDLERLWDNFKTTLR